MGAHPDEIVGHLHIVRDDETFQGAPIGCDNQLVSGNPHGHEAIGSFPVIARAILALPDIATFDYPTT